MIRINLLPTKQTKTRATVERTSSGSQVSPVTLLIIVAVVAVLGGWWYLLIQKPKMAKSGERNTLAAEVKSIDTEITDLRERVVPLKKMDAIGESMLDIVNALDPDDRLLWSAKLNQISDLIPDNVYITRLTVTEEIRKVETAGSKRRRTQYDEKMKTWTRNQGPKPTPPPQIFYPEVTQTLTIYGIAYSQSEPERIRLINSFWDNLKNGHNPKTNVQVGFMDGFLGTINYGVVETKDYGGRRVADFSFTIRTQPTGPANATATGGV